MMSSPHPGRFAEQKRRALALLQQGRLKQACSLYEKLCRQDRSDPESLYMLGSVYGQMGKFENAARHLQECIRLQPGAFVAHCALGAARKELGQYAEAERAFREALRLQPGNTDVLLELAGSLLHQDRLEAAEEALQQVLQARPDSAEALHALGEIRHANQQYAQAVDCYARALKVKPDRAITHNRLGHALHQQGKYETALTHFEQAVQLEPRLVEAHTNAGNTELALGRMEAARNAFRKALAISPDDLGATLGEIRLYEQEGDAASAYTRIQTLLAKDVESPGLAINFLNICHRHDCCSEAIAYAEKLLSARKIPAVTESQIRFALGKTLDRLGSFDEAFSNYRQANDLRPDSYDASEHADMVDALIERFTWQFLATAPRASVRSERPVFIIGMPRSGTSLTEQILASHPEVHGAGELVNIGHIVTALSGVTGPRFARSGFLDSLTTPLLDRYATEYLDYLAALDPAATRVTDKMPHNFMFLGIIALMFPGARIIHCRRDPRDTCLSIYFQDFSLSHSYATRLANIGHYHYHYDRLMRHFRGLLDIPVLEIHYEELVSHQEATTRKLIEFAGLAWDDRCLAFEQTARTVATASYDQVRQAMYSSSAGRWRHYEKYLGPLLEALHMQPPSTTGDATEQ